MVIRELKLKIDVSPTEIAEAFLRMENTDKARFLNAFGFFLELEPFDIYHFDLIAIGEEEILNQDGKRALGLFKVYQEELMSDIKIGDLVVFNDKYWVSEKHRNIIFKVKSEPWVASGTMLVLLEGFSGGYALDGLKKVKMMEKQETVTDTIAKVREETCEKICKYPSLYTAQEWEENYVEICRNCPMDRL